MSDRRRLPSERKSITHRFKIEDVRAFVTVGLFDDGTPGELFVRISKEGSTLSGVMEAFAIMVSIALQHDVPLADIVRKLKGMKFEPDGATGNKEIPRADSIIDYMMKWLEARFLETKK